MLLRNQTKLVIFKKIFISFLFEFCTVNFILKVVNLEVLALFLQFYSTIV